MAEREKNGAFWKQMRARHTRRVAEYAHKYGLSLKQASLELEWRDMLDEEVNRQLRLESEPFIPRSSDIEEE